MVILLFKTAICKFLESNINFRSSVKKKKKGLFLLVKGIVHEKKKIADNLLALRQSNMEINLFLNMNRF